MRVNFRGDNSHRRRNFAKLLVEIFRGVSKSLSLRYARVNESKVREERGWKFGRYFSTEKSEIFRWKRPLRIVFPREYRVIRKIRIESLRKCPNVSISSRCYEKLSIASFDRNFQRTRTDSSLLETRYSSRVLGTRLCRQLRPFFGRGCGRHRYATEEFQVSSFRRS